MSKKDSKIKYVPVYGGNPLYLYENVQINELNYLKEILVEECHKISEIYESAMIHPLWMERLNEILYSVEGLLNIILSMLQVYSARDSKNINTLVNKLNDVYELSHLIYIYHWELYAYKHKEKQQ